MYGRKEAKKSQVNLKKKKKKGYQSGLTDTTVANLVVWELKLWQRGLPWWSSGLASTLPMQGAWAGSMVRELDPTPCN